jgi:hypothetical protein
MFKIFYTLIYSYYVIPQKQIQTQIDLKVVAITTVQSKWKFWWFDKFSLNSPLSNSIKRLPVWFSSCHFCMHKHSRQLLAPTLCCKNGWAEVGDGSAQNQGRTYYTHRTFSFSYYLKHCKNVTQSILDWYSLNPLNIFVQAPCTWKWFFKILLLHTPTHLFWSWKPSHTF